MTYRKFEQVSKDGDRLMAYVNTSNLIYISILNDNSEDCELQCTTLDLDDAVELYKELGKLIAEMNGAPNKE